MELTIRAILENPASEMCSWHIRIKRLILEIL